LTTVYVAFSWLVLDGKITYWTSFNESTIEGSKKEKLYVTDTLVVQTKGDSLNNYKSLFNIWTNKRYEIKYFGFFFYWTHEDPSWRYLNIESKQSHIDNSGNNSWFRRRLFINQSVYDYTTEGDGWEPCCGRVRCNVGDTVRVEFIKGTNADSIIGQISVLIK
jgi:hypothetical protein